MNTLNIENYGASISFDQIKYHNADDSKMIIQTLDYGGSAIIQIEPHHVKQVRDFCNKFLEE